MTTLLIAGASGFLGTALTHYAKGAGYEVRRLVRHEARAPEEISWDPLYGELSEDALTGIDAVVCVSGAGIANKPWTASRKQEIVTSRVGSVSLLAQTIATIPKEKRPTVFISGSAIGYYGTAEDRVLAEDASNGSGFLAHVCRAWEAAAQPAADAGVRTVQLRTGHLMDRGDGLLGILGPLYRAHLGARLGSGDQYFPTIWIKDAVAAIVWAIEHDDISGPMNLVGPDPVPFTTWHEQAQEVFNARSFLTAPTAALKATGGMGKELLLTSQRAVPKKLLDSGFVFEADTAHKILARAAAGPYAHPVG